ncbi:hypothetical protein ACLI4Y_11735 [Natrialbaceae archaeon A-CW3]
MQPRTPHQSEQDWSRQWERRHGRPRAQARTQSSQPPTGDRKRLQATQRDLEALRTRLEATERRQQRLLNTVAGLARASGVSVGSPCNRCDRSHLLVTTNAIHCPSCGYARPL